MTNLNDVQKIKEPTISFVESIKRGDWEIGQIYALNQIVFERKGKRITLNRNLQLLTNRDKLKLQLSVFESELIATSALKFIDDENKKNEERIRKEFFDYLKRG